MGSKTLPATLSESASAARYSPILGNRISGAATRAFSRRADHSILPSYLSAPGCPRSDKIFSDTEGMTGASKTAEMRNASAMLAREVSSLALSAGSTLLASFHGARCSAYLFIARTKEKIFSRAIWNCIPSLSSRTSGAVSAARALGDFSKSSSTDAGGATPPQ